MGTTELSSVCREASEEAARINARTSDKLLKRARKLGVADDGEATELVKAWQRAAKKTKRLAQQAVTYHATLP
jgi:hypothetical protein